MLRYSWIILLIFSSYLGAYSSFKSFHGGKYWIWLILLAGILNTLTWVIVTKVSKNLIFDNLIFNTGICLVYAIGLASLGCAQNFTIINWTGLAICIFGLILLKI